MNTLQFNAYDPNLFNLRELYGEVVETATIARLTLAPLAGRLSGGDPSTLHRRCVVGHTIDILIDPDDVRDDLASFGAIEAVAVCEVTISAVIVFWDEASVAVTLARQQETTRGWFTAVPPLDEALPLGFFAPGPIKVALYTQAQAAATFAAAALATPRRRRLRPCYRYRDSPHEEWSLPPETGTTRFFPSEKSLIYGPVMGADGHLWMDGKNKLYEEDGTRTYFSWIRVTLLNSMTMYCSDAPMFVPLYSVDLDHSHQ